MTISNFDLELKSLLEGINSDKANADEIEVLLNAATSTVQDVKEKNTVVQNKAAKKVDVFTSIGQQLEQQLAKQKANADKAAEINKNINIAAGEANKNPVQTYNNRVSGQAATKTREQITKEYQDAQIAYQQTLDSVNESGFIMKAIKTQTQLIPAQERLATAQRNLNANQVVTATATQNLFNTMKANTAVAGQASATELALSQYDQEVTGNMIKELAEKRVLAKEDLAVYAQQLQLNESSLSTAIKEISIAKEKRLLTGASVQDIMARAQLSTFLEEQDRVAGNREKQKAFIESQEVIFKQYLENSNRESEIGTNTFEANFILQRPDASNPDVAGFYAFKKNNVSNETAYIDAVAKADTGAPLTEVEKTEILIGERLAQEWNQQIAKDIAKLDIDDPVAAQRAKEALQAKQLDPRKPEDRVEISKLMMDFKKDAQTDASDALSLGVMQMPDMKAALQDPEFEEFQALIPEDVKELLLSDAFKDIDFSLSSPDPAGSLDGTMQNLATALEGLSSSTQEQDELATNISRGLSGYYKAVRKASVNSMGFRDVPSITLSGVNTHTPSGWLSGVTELRSMNLENAGELKTLLLNTLRERRTKRKSATSNVLGRPSIGNF